MSASGLADRFRDHVRRRGWLEDWDAVVVAFSGGVDSTVLLHLFRFETVGSAPKLVAAHFDHGMRPGSAGDVDWVRGLARAWDVEFRVGRAADPLSDEAAAREARYAFLERIRRQEEAARVLTAHHADDQAETVLFRALRGSGLRGLGGIPETRAPGIVRPLLPFWKDEILAYARAVGIRPRIDPSNRDPRFARNVLRHRILPELEESVAPGARRSLVRLAGLARSEERALAALARDALRGLIEESDEGSIVVAREGLLSYDSTVQGRVLRQAAAKLGIRLDRAGTRAAVEFTSEGASGRRLELPGGIVFARDFDRFTLTRGTQVGEDESLALQEPGVGSGGFSVGGRRLRAQWAQEPSVAGDWVERFSPSVTRFPLLLRSWAPGDRIRLSYGSKKLKKLFSEERIPAGSRSRIPVLADAEGAVLWVPGVARSVQALPEQDEEPFYLGVTDADD